MLGKTAASLGLAVGLLAISATPTMAHTLNLKVTATCACEYTVTATGNSDASTSVTIAYSFTVTSNGINYPVSKSFQASTDDHGDFSVELSDLPLPGTFDDTVDFSLGSATLTFPSGPPKRSASTCRLPCFVPTATPSGQDVGHRTLEHGRPSADPAG